MTDSIRGFGTYFFPPLFFEKVIAIHETDLLVDKTFYEFPFNNDRIFIHQSGFLSTDKDDREHSTEILNSIFLSTTLLKYRVRKTYPKELAEVKIDPTTKKLKNLEVTPFIDRGWLHISPDMREDYTQILTTEEFKVILDLAEKFFRSKSKIAIFTFYECYTEWDKRKYTNCFLLGWITLEIFFSKKLEEYFVKKGVFQKLIEKINKEWSVHKKMQYLKTEGIISKNEFKKYEKLRMVRNRIIHSEYRPTSDDAEDCKLIANSALWEFFRMEGIDYNFYLDRISMLSQQK